MFSKRKPSNFTRAPVFSVRKKHSWKNDLVKLFEILLIVGVIGGTIFWVGQRANTSLPNVINLITSKLKPEIPIEPNQVEMTDEETLKSMLEKEKVFEVVSIKNVDNGYEVSSKDSATIIFAKDKDFSESISTLQTLLAKAKIDNKSVKRVDFRFEKIVVQY